ARLTRRYRRVWTTATAQANAAKSSNRVSRFRRGINALVSLLWPGVDSNSEVRRETRGGVRHSISMLGGILVKGAFPVPVLGAIALKLPKGSAWISRVLGYNRITVSGVR